MKRAILFGCLTFLASITYADTNPTPQAQCAASGIDFNQAAALSEKIYSYVQNNEPKKLAALASYPLSINYSGQNIKTVKILNKNEFLNAYPKLSKALKNALTNTKPTDIFCNFQGAMIANGTFWFTGTNQLKFFVVNI